VIPDFDEQGYLPPGIHPATMEEIRKRFGSSSEIRQVEYESLIWLVDAARDAGALRIVLNGSFVTDVDEPNDVDCALMIPEGNPQNRELRRLLLHGLPFLTLEVAEPAAFAELTDWLWANRPIPTPQGTRGDHLMALNSDLELRVTREKLARLEELYDRTASRTEELSPAARDLTLISLKRLMNKLTEEIVRYEIRQRAEEKAPQGRASESAQRRDPVL
jgi:hypothetical protein